jgi:ribonuclease Z
MESIIVLGTGHALVTKCYNTCFALYDGDEYFLVDAGGGNGILSQCEQAGIQWGNVHHLFVTHRHTDHVLGAIWVIRVIGRMILSGNYAGNLNIYCHAQLGDAILTICEVTLQKNITDLFGDRLRIIKVDDEEKKQILNYSIVFFDIHSTKAKQFGFSTRLNNGRRLTCLGDEPYQSSCYPYVNQCDWLLSEAFCLYSQRDIYKPYTMNHSTVKDACELAQKMNVKNLVLWHTEEDNLAHRQKLYTVEGKLYYNGNIFVPNDLDYIVL